MHCVDLGESFPIHIFLQTLASIQPTTGPVKFARSPRTDPPGYSFDFLDRRITYFFGENVIFLCENACFVGSCEFAFFVAKTHFRCENAGSGPTGGGN